jgi:hypothetical protein
VKRKFFNIKISPVGYNFMLILISTGVVQDTI